METKEKLTEIIGNVVVNDKGNRIRDVFHPEFVEKIVENLIKHDAETVVRCKDCKHNTDNGGDCDRTLIHTRRNLVTETNEYLYFKLNCCEYGERKEGEADA